MSFTKHIKNLKPNQLPQKLLDELNSALHREMNRYKLLNKPPAYLGYIDWTSWNEPAAFDEILLDCYMDTIFKQLRVLQGYIELDQNIDGMIFKNIKWFVTGKMRANDPVGYAVFQNTKGAIKCGINRGVISLNDEANKINNNTLLIFSSSTTHSNKDLISQALRKNPVWTQELQLKLSKQKNSTKVKENFCALICELKSSGVGSFLVKDLVDVIKDEVRQTVEELEIIETTQPDYIDKTKMQGNSEDEELQAVLFSLPDDENYQIFREWCRDIIKAIAQSKYKSNVRQELMNIFTEIEVPIRERAAPPLQADLVKSLGFKAPKISERMKQLRELVAQIKGI